MTLLHRNGVHLLYSSHDLAISIKNEAKKNGIAIKDMLSDLKIGSNTMSALYHGKSIAFDSLARIADYLGCSIDFLLGRTDVRETENKKTAPLIEKQLVHSFEGKDGLGTSEQELDVSKLESLNNLHKAASTLSAEQIDLLTNMAKNMK